MVKRYFPPVVRAVNSLGISLIFLGYLLWTQVPSSVPDTFQPWTVLVIWVMASVAATVCAVYDHAQLFEAGAIVCGLGCMVIIVGAIFLFVPGENMRAIIALLVCTIFLFGSFIKT